MIFDIIMNDENDKNWSENDIINNIIKNNTEYNFYNENNKFINIRNRNYIYEPLVNMFEDYKIKRQAIYSYYRPNQISICDKNELNNYIYNFFNDKIRAEICKIDTNFRADGLPMTDKRLPTINVMVNGGRGSSHESLHKHYMVIGMRILSINNDRK